MVIPPYGHTVLFCVRIHQLMDVWVVSTLVLLGVMLTNIGIHYFFVLLYVLTLFVGRLPKSGIIGSCNSYV